MPITAIDPTAALLVIDLQQGLADAPTVHPVHEIASTTGVLADAFRVRGLPVVLVTAIGRPPGRSEQGAARMPSFSRGWAEPLPQLRPQPGDHRVVKERWGAFHDTDLAEHLDELGVTQVVLAGVATSIGVESTARAAHDRGLHVAVVTDAVTDTHPGSHEHSLDRIFPRLGETGSSTEVLALLAARER